MVKELVIAYLLQETEIELLKKQLYKAQETMDRAEQMRLVKRINLLTKQLEMCIEKGWLGL